MILTEKNAAQYRKDGYIIVRDFFALEKLELWEKTIASIYALQALKLRPLRAKLSPQLDPTKCADFKTFNKVVNLLEEYDKMAAYQALTMCTRSVAANNLLADAGLRAACSELLACPEELIQYGALSFFINIPGNKRTATKWHSEANYYPKRRSILNIWIPTFRDKDRSNGTMWVRPGTHAKDHWDYIEYFGHDDASFNAKNHIRQLEIPEEELAAYPKVPIEAKRGDIVFFQRNLVHATGENSGKDLSLSTVLRAFDYRKDLSLDANASAGMGFPDFARPGLVPLY